MLRVKNFKNKMKSIVKVSNQQRLLLSFFFVLNLFFFVWGQDNIPNNGDKKEPYFIEEPYDIRIKENSRVILPCRIAGLDRQVIDGGGAHVQWTKDGFGLGTGRQLDDWPHFRMVGRNLESKHRLLFHVSFLVEIYVESQVSSFSSIGIDFSDVI